MVKTSRPYWEVQITIPRQYEEGVSNFLIEAGSSGIKIDQNHTRSRLSGYFGQTGFGLIQKRIHNYLEDLARLFPEKFSFRLRRSLHRTLDWSKKWRENFKPVLLGKKFAIVPAWDKGNFPQPLVIKIYPQMAFGTGTHPTTQACLLVLQKLVRPGDRVLDLGTGSGILAIAAAKLGAESVTAVDMDRGVAENARKNFRLNRVEKKIKLKIGRLKEAIISTPFDLAVANLTGEEILEEIEKLKSQVKSGGYLIISGWTREESAGLGAFLKRKRLKVVQRIEKKGWVTVVCKK